MRWNEDRGRTKEIIEAFDKNGDGVLNLEEFIECMINLEEVEGFSFGNGEAQGFRDVRRQGSLLGVASAALFGKGPLQEETTTTRRRRRRTRRRWLVESGPFAEEKGWVICERSRSAACTPTRRHSVRRFQFALFAFQSRVTDSTRDDGIFDFNVPSDECRGVGVWVGPTGTIAPTSAASAFHTAAIAAGRATATEPPPPRLTFSVRLLFGRRSDGMSPSAREHSVPQRRRRGRSRCGRRIHSSTATTLRLPIRSSGL